MLRHLVILVLLLPFALLANPGAPVPGVAVAELTTENLLLTFPATAPATGQAVRETLATMTYHSPGGSRRLSAQLDADLPVGARLEVLVRGAGMSVGWRPLSSRATTIAFHLPPVESGTLQLHYRLTYDIQTPPETYARVVSFTLIDL